MTTLLQLVAAARPLAMRTAIVTALAAEYPECQVKTHPGKLDIADVDAEDLFRPPALAVAVVAQRPSDERMSGTRDETVDVAIYVVVEDKGFGTPSRLTTRDELGLALCSGLVSFVSQPAVGRWGLADIGYPEEVAARPLLSILSQKRGTAYYVVTWRQTLYAAGTPLWGDGPAPDPAFDILCPGDPGFEVQP